MLILTFLASSITSIVNAALYVIVRKFSSYEKHKTISNYYLATAVKLTLVTFFNTAIVPLLSNVVKDDWFDQSGLVIEVLVKVFFLSFFSNLIFRLYSIWLLSVLDCLLDSLKK